MRKLKKLLFSLALASLFLMGCDGPTSPTSKDPRDIDLKNLNETERKAIQIVAKIHLLQNWLFGDESFGIFNFKLADLNPLFSSTFGEDCKAKPIDSKDHQQSLLLFASKPNIEYDNINCPIKYKSLHKQNYKPQPHQRIYQHNPEIIVSPTSHNSKYLNELHLSGESEQIKRMTGKQSGEVLAVEKLEGEVLQAGQTYALDYFSEIEYIWENNIAYYLKGQRKWVIQLQNRAVEILETIHWSDPRSSFVPETRFSINGRQISMQAFENPAILF